MKPFFPIIVLLLVLPSAFGQIKFEKIYSDQDLYGVSISSSSPAKIKAYYMDMPIYSEGSIVKAASRGPFISKGVSSKKFVMDSYGDEFYVRYVAMSDTSRRVKHRLIINK